ncbi:MAG TPA: zinc ABC transporter ATP-binding protein ZnuC [Candidatus Competibacteraceae bacterium]|nr:zinc ABC transporter ATP-binding protein ZnuC [Candidatus Competibacteraceae bacterium]HQA24793.1 zinc ABC transporter ATP-binding protein ZnuC [Candidatus Competibacteraceae bacterium]HQD55453.1 zinc ABC transporter ATP-binding protein ZnuC [Candidatus Competibacteraceae bacterium]
MPADVLLTVERVSFATHGNAILEDVSLQLAAGEIVALIGPNGAGKSTLIRIVLGLLRPSRGRVWLKPGLRVGYMPQRLAIDGTLPLTVRRFITLGAPASHQRVQAALAEVGAAHVLDTPVQAISGGELQRVLLARALLREPDLLVLDEPSQGVDLNGQYELYELIGRLRQQRGCGILMVSHELQLVMAATDHVVCLNRHVCCSGHPDHVVRDPGYLALFGLDGVRNLAIYHHHHNHRHDLHGAVVKETDAHR